MRYSIESGLLSVEKPGTVCMHLQLQIFNQVIAISDVLQSLAHSHSNKFNYCRQKIWVGGGEGGEDGLSSHP